jgi:hypothetical protein
LVLIIPIVFPVNSKAFIAADLNHKREILTVDKASSILAKLNLEPVTNKKTKNPTSARPKIVKKNEILVLR